MDKLDVQDQQPLAKSGNVAEENKFEIDSSDYSSDEEYMTKLKTTKDKHSDFEEEEKKDGSSTPGDEQEAKQSRDVSSSDKGDSDEESIKTSNKPVEPKLEDIMVETLGKRNRLRELITREDHFECSKDN